MIPSAPKKGKCVTMSVNEADCRTLPFRLSHPPRKPTFENRKAQTKRLNPNLIHHPSKAKQEEKARSCFTTDFATLFRKPASPRAVPNKHAEKKKRKKNTGHMCTILKAGLVGVRNRAYKNPSRRRGSNQTKRRPLSAVRPTGTGPKSRVRASPVTV